MKQTSVQAEAAIPPASSFEWSRLHPVNASGALIVSTCGMQELTSEARMALTEAASGITTQSWEVWKQSFSKGAVETRAIRALGARTLSHAVAIGIQLGAVTVTPASTRRRGLSEAESLYVQAKQRGAEDKDISRLAGLERYIPVRLPTLQRGISSLFGLSESINPRYRDSRFVHCYYARSPSLVPKEPELAFRRYRALVRLRSLFRMAYSRSAHIQRFDDTTLTPVSDVMPDVITQTYGQNARTSNVHIAWLYDWFSGGRTAAEAGLTEKKSAQTLRYFAKAININIPPNALVELAHGWTNSYYEY